MSLVISSFLAFCIYPVSYVCRYVLGSFVSSFVPSLVRSFVVSPSGYCAIYVFSYLCLCINVCMGSLFRLFGIYFVS